MKYFLTKAETESFIFFVGPSGLQGPKGVDGDLGPSGRPGRDGTDGRKGKNQFFSI